MELYDALLARAHLSVISSEPDHELDRIARIVTPSARASGCAELEALFARLLAAAGATAAVVPKTLDLLGHSTARGQLRIGDWVIDAGDPAVAEWCRGIAAGRVLERLGIRAVRLLGCRTADTDPGRSTICRLAELLGVEVHGAKALLYFVHYDADGFRDGWKFLLVSSTDLRRADDEPALVPGDGWPRRLDLDALPSLPLAAHVARWPQQIATAQAAHRILALVRGDAGARMPGPAATPSVELALPSATPGAFHVAHVLLGGAFLQFYPDGSDAPGVAFPVDDAPELLRIMASLPPAEPAR